MALRNSLTIITTTLKGEKAFSLPLSLQTPKDILFSINEYDDAVAINESEDYEIYIKRVKSNALARAVKIQDLRHNSDLTRLRTVTDADLARVKKYEYYLKALD